MNKENKGGNPKLGGVYTSIFDFENADVGYTKVDSTYLPIRL